ncbi:hypothetical protein [Caldimonas thermodepolymerans]|uniref:Uncharacterized protein n=1 Tax=Caldimonas thermodepolymerans TaxID=215580 RepID=A0AA46DCM8_9BURK|nr:hypothetical protein [Caldimonas thermodepolymerans]TCP04947.1 hypothetical protein EV676_10933 [Caldimonas thermodepolymerans]UZG48321.1 hypothetical protein ONS87_01515 [Caldimonas thermodepolymerans]
MKQFAASASASTVLAQHVAAQQQRQQRPAALPSGTTTGLRQYQVLQSRVEPAQRTLALRMR